MAIAILALVMAGMIYGYVESNYRAEWSSMSLAAQSVASKAVEQARAAKWDVHLSSSQTGSGTSDELPPTNYIQTNVLIIPGRATVAGHQLHQRLQRGPPSAGAPAAC